MTTTEIVQHDHEGEGRYEVLVDGETAGALVYRSFEGRRVFVHTEVDDAYEGQGLAGKLARRALDDARAEGLAIVPLCPFVAGYLEKHPDDQDLVDQDLYAQLR
jgi:predicted GNAT family acetyltransferase